MGEPWEDRFRKTDNALAAIAVQIDKLAQAVGKLQAAADAEVVEDRKQKDAIEARFKSQEQILSSMTAQVASFRTEEAAAEKKQDADWQARFQAQEQIWAAMGTQIGTLGQAVGVVQQAVDVVRQEELELAKKENEREEAWEERFRHQQESMGAIYAQLVDVRKGVEGMQTLAQEANLRRRLELVPVRIGDLMRGFQSAVSRANHATRAGESDGEDIEQMAVKDLEVSMQAPVIEGGHAEDPTVMLPNIKSVDRDTASVTIKFNVVTLPAKQKG